LRRRQTRVSGLPAGLRRRDLRGRSKFSAVGVPVRDLFLVRGHVDLVLARDAGLEILDRLAETAAELYDLSWDPSERSDLAELRPEISGPLIEEAQRLVDEIGLADSSGGAEAPSAAEFKVLRGLGYVE